MNNSIELFDRRIKLPKLDLAKIENSQFHHGRILSATIRKTPTEKYFVSLLVEKEIYAFPKTGTTVGIDLGLSDFALGYESCKKVLWANCPLHIRYNTIDNLSYYRKCLENEPDRTVLEQLYLLTTETYQAPHSETSRLLLDYLKTILKG